MITLFSIAEVVVAKTPQFNLRLVTCADVDKVARESFLLELTKNQLELITNRILLYAINECWGSFKTVLESTPAEIFTDALQVYSESQLEYALMHNICGVFAEVEEIAGISVFRFKTRDYGVLGVHYGGRGFFKVLPSCRTQYSEKSLLTVIEIIEML